MSNSPSTIVAALGTIEAPPAEAPPATPAVMRNAWLQKRASTQWLGKMDASRLFWNGVQYTSSKGEAKRAQAVPVLRSDGSKTPPTRHGPKIRIVEVGHKAKLRKQASQRRATLERTRYARQFTPSGRDSLTAEFLLKQARTDPLVAEAYRLFVGGTDLSTHVIPTGRI